MRQNEFLDSGTNAASESRSAGQGYDKKDVLVLLKKISLLDMNKNQNSQDHMVNGVNQQALKPGGIK